MHTLDAVVEISHGLKNPSGTPSKEHPLRKTLQGKHSKEDPVRKTLEGVIEVDLHFVSFCLLFAPGSHSGGGLGGGSSYVRPPGVGFDPSPR